MLQVVYIDCFDLFFYRIVGLPPVFTKQALLNRQNPKIYEVFSNILGEKVGLPITYYVTVCMILREPCYTSATYAGTNGQS